MTRYIAIDGNKVRTSKGCLYVTKLTNIDIGVLTNMIESSYKLYAKT